MSATEKQTVAVWLILWGIVLYFITAPANAGDWSKADTKREVAYQVVAAMDWAQTRYIAESCHTDKHFLETNLILGECPSDGRVNTYFVISGLAHYGVSRLLSPKHRETWQAFTLVIETSYVANNITIGVGMKF